MDAELLELMPQIVTIEPVTKDSTTGEPQRNEYGETTFGDAREVRARVEGRVRVVTAMTGEQRVSTSTVYLGEVVGVSPNDRITLPEGFTPRQPEILAVERMPDEDGDYYEALFT